jgi:DNA-binding NarL/FixJ family response regulator
MKTATKSECAPAFKTLRVVMVEDSLPIVERIKGMIESVSGTILIGTCDNATAALDLIVAGKPDVAILDIHLKNADGKNGIYLLSQVRKLFPTLKIIMLTNLSDLRYRLLCTEYGADYFFDKSNDFDKIPETLRHILTEEKS